MPVTGAINITRVKKKKLNLVGIEIGWCNGLHTSLQSKTDRFLQIKFSS